VTFCLYFKSSELVSSFYPRGIARGLMAGVAQRNIETISNQSGDTFLLSDVDTDLPSVEQPAALPVPNVSGNSSGPVCNVSYAAVAAESSPTTTPRAHESYRNENFLSNFERANFHRDVTPERPCSAYFQSSVFNDSTAVFSALKSQGFAPSSIRCLQRRPTGEMLITFSSEHMKKTFVHKNIIQISQRRYAINNSDRFLTY